MSKLYELCGAQPVNFVLNISNKSEMKKLGEIFPSIQTSSIYYNFTEKDAGDFEIFGHAQKVKIARITNHRMQIDSLYSQYKHIEKMFDDNEEAYITRDNFNIISRNVQSVEDVMWLNNPKVILDMKIYFEIEKNIKEFSKTLCMEE